MRTLTALLALACATSLNAQTRGTIDMHCCEPGKWHTARDCRGCGRYTGKALLCYNATDPNLRFVEIIVPQRFADLDAVRFTFRVRALEGRGHRFELKQVDRNHVGDVNTQIAPLFQTTDGSKPTEQYYVKYCIRGR